MQIAITITAVLLVAGVVYIDRSNLKTRAIAAEQALIRSAAEFVSCGRSKMRAEVAAVIEKVRANAAEFEQAVIDKIKAEVDKL